MAKEGSVLYGFWPASSNGEEKDWRNHYKNKEYICALFISFSSAEV